MKLNSFIGEMKLLKDKDEFRQKVELWLLNSEVNRNDWQYKNIKDHLKDFIDTPILIAYVGDKIGDGHNMDEIKDENGDIKASFMKSTAERIVGTFSQNADIRIEVKDGVEWVVGTGFIWKWYAQELVKKLKRQAYSGMSVSIETLVYDEYEENGVSVFTDYEILGTTILGDDVTPAIAGANIKLLSALGSEKIRNMTLRVASANPQQTTKKRSEQKMTVKKLQEVIGDGTVLAVNEHSALVATSNEFYTCEYSVEDDNITVGEACPVEKCSFNSGNDDLTVDFEKITNRFNSMLSKAQSDYETEKTARVNAEEIIEKMKRTEHNRRIEAVKNAITKRFAEISANREIDKEIIEPLYAKLEDYSKLETEEGEFCGEIEACKDVDTICMGKILEADKKMCELKENAFLWDSTGRTKLNAVDDMDRAFDNINGKGE